MAWWIVLAAVWAVSGAFAYALGLAHFQREYPSIAVESRRGDMFNGIFVAIFGPIGLLATWINCGTRHGLLWRPITEDEAADLRVLRNAERDAEIRRQIAADLRAMERIATREAKP